MNKIAIIGAGKTGRGFIGRLIFESMHNASHGSEIQEIMFIDKDKYLVDSLNKKGSYQISFFSDCRTDITITDYHAHTWDTADFSDVELIFVSVYGTNLVSVGKELRERLLPNREYFIITCENAAHPSETLRDAIDMKNVHVSEATVFCTTTASYVSGTGKELSSDFCLDICSENYPYLQCNADHLDGYQPPVIGVQAINKFGDFLTRKLFTYNAASCVIAYLGYVKGFTDYGEAANDPEIMAMLDKNYEVTNRVLCAEFGYDPKEQEEFALLSRKKFCDVSIKDTIARNAHEPQRKLASNERVIGPLLMMQKHNEDTEVLEHVLGAMLEYDGDDEECWREIKGKMSNEQILKEICEIEQTNVSLSKALKYAEKYHESLSNKKSRNSSV